MLKLTWNKINERFIVLEVFFSHDICIEKKPYISYEYKKYTDMN